MKLPIFLVFLIVATSSAKCIFDEWSVFKLAHSKNYTDPTEENFRQKIFQDNWRKIMQHNQLYDLGKVSYKLGLNEYTDMLHHEFTAEMTGFDSDLMEAFRAESEEAVSFMGPTFNVPNAMNWQQKGAVTEVKNQKQCGSCWAFSATGSLEGQIFRKKGKLVSLSEQNLVDCSGKYGNNGCHGGLMHSAFQYIKDNGGIDTEQSYPYEAKDSSCRYNPRNSGGTSKGYVPVPQSEEEIKKAVATVGPISVALDASRKSFQFYSNGIYFDSQCSGNNLNHAVLIVGYGTDRGQDYWLVKNSWGKSWGMQGYIKMARNKNNHCGIGKYAVYPLV